MSRVMLTTGLIVAYGYAIEAFSAWYSGNRFELFMVKNRATGPYAFEYWMLILCNILIPQLLWWKKARRPTLLLWGISIVINVGMWLERYVIIVLSLHATSSPRRGDVPRHDLGRFDVRRDARPLPLAPLPLHPVPPAINIFEVRP